MCMHASYSILILYAYARLPYGGILILWGPILNFVEGQSSKFSRLIFTDMCNHAHNCAYLTGLIFVYKVIHKITS